MDIFNGRKMLRTAEVAELLGVHINTARRWMDVPGGIPYYRIASRMHMFDKAEVLAWLEAHKHNAHTPPVSVNATPAPLTIREREAMAQGFQLGDVYRHTPPAPTPADGLKFDERMKLIREQTREGARAIIAEAKAEVEAAAAAVGEKPEPSAVREKIFEKVRKSA